MIHVKKNIRYYINERALAFTENALDDANRIYVSLLAGSVMYVHIPGVIDFGPDGNHEKFHLEGYSTKVASNAPYNIYARIDKELRTALILFSTKEYKADGSVNGDPSSQPSSVNVYIKIGFMTAPDGKSGKRTLTYDSGVLGTDKGNQMASESVFSEMFELDKISTPWLIKVKQLFYEFTVKKGITLLGDLVFKGKRILDVALSTDENYIREPSDDTLATTKFVNRVTEGRFLRKDKSDQTAHLQKFLGGVEFDKILKSVGAIDSMPAGKGIIMDALRGVIQTDGLEVRGYMKVIELIINRISAMESDYSFSESGTIEKVELMPDGTRRLYMRKRWENDLTALQTNDIIYGIVNNLAGGGTDYYTSWMRVVHVDTAANTIDVTLYPDAEVPGGRNFPPVELMVVTHRGNPVNKDRQAYWYLSSAEHCICMLDGVTKPILEEHNYSIIVGRLKHLSIFDNLPINYLQSYIYCRGIATQDMLQVDYKGNPIRQENNRGKWSADEAQSNPYQSGDTLYDAVYHFGCKWMCLVKGTLQEPCFGCTDWAMIEGNPDFSIDLHSSKGWFFDAETFATEISVTGELYNQDVTAQILDADVTWARDTGRVTEDNAWTAAHAEIGKRLTLSVEDLGPEYQALTGAKFICTALLRDGQPVRAAQAEVII